MKIAGREILEDFKKKHADAREQLDAWLAEVEEANWASPNDLKARYASASFVGDRRVVFNIKGKQLSLGCEGFIQTACRVNQKGWHAC